MTTKIHRWTIIGCALATSACIAEQPGLSDNAQSTALQSEQVSLPPHKRVVSLDEFSDDVGEWQPWIHGAPWRPYELAVDTAAPGQRSAASVSGDGFRVNSGMQKQVILPARAPSDRIIIAFDWRAASEFAASVVTNATFELYDAADNRLLHQAVLASGGTVDTGWQRYEQDITAALGDVDQITVVLRLRDAWIADWKQVNWYDDVLITRRESTGEDRVISFDDFEAGVSDWRPWLWAPVWESWPTDPYAASLVTAADADGGVVRIAGDGFDTENGIHKEIRVPSLSTGERLVLGFDWRATSQFSDSVVTNAALELYDSLDGALLAQDALASGGTLDTGWRHYQRDITDWVSQTRRIRVVLRLRDAWTANWQQSNEYDNVFLVVVDDDTNDVDCTRAVHCPGSRFVTRFTSNDDIVALRACSSIEDDLIIAYNTESANVAGLECIAAVGGNLYAVANYGSVTTLAGLNSLRFVGENLLIAYNPRLTSLNGLEQIEFIGGNLVVSRNRAMSTLSGLAGLQFLGRELYIRNNETLPACEVEALSARFPGALCECSENNGTQTCN